MTASEVLKKYQGDYGLDLAEEDVAIICAAMNEYRYCNFPVDDYAAVMDTIHKMWVDSVAVDGKYPSEVLIPVAYEDIKRSELGKYAEYIERAYQRANARIIGEIFKDE